MARGVLESLVEVQPMRVYAIRPPTGIEVHSATSGRGGRAMEPVEQRPPMAFASMFRNRDEVVDVQEPSERQ